VSDLPKAIEICEKGPREGMQIEKGPISTARKIELIDALSDTGLQHIQTVSFVNPKRVPSMADADAVIAGITPRPGVNYSVLWLNDVGLERALKYRDGSNSAKRFRWERPSRSRCATKPRYRREHRDANSHSTFSNAITSIWRARSSPRLRLQFCRRIPIATCSRRSSKP